MMMITIWAQFPPGEKILAGNVQSAAHEASDDDNDSDDDYNDDDDDYNLVMRNLQHMRPLTS